jgi:hypothetical protein
MLSEEFGMSLANHCHRIVVACCWAALVLPKSGVAAAVCYGTSYTLRVPMKSRGEAIAEGAKTKNVWSNGAETDIQAEFGADWFFGSWSATEIAWCLQTYKNFEMVTP